LLRRGPRLADGTDTLILTQESTVDAAKRVGTLLDCSVLPIQGPPGAGKTFTGAGHKVIQNLLLEVGTADIVKGLKEHRIDFGILRRSAVVAPAEISLDRSSRLPPFSFPLAWGYVPGIHSKLPLIPLTSKNI
jgi:hypothetical protein